MSAQTLPKEIETLKEDLVKITSDLSGLTSKYGKEGEEKVKEVADDVIGSLKQQLSFIRDKISEIAEENKERIKNVDAKIHEKPYLFLIFALALGFLLGKFQGRE